LLAQGVHCENSTFPNGNTIQLSLSIGKEKHLSYEHDEIRIILPNQLIQDYKPSKIGISLIFHMDSNNSHEIIFEVDIKKAPLSSRSS